MEGRVRHSNGRIRISVQLIHAGNVYHLWSESYDREMTGVFAVQEEISQAIARLLKVKLGATPAGPLVRRGTENQYAHHLIQNPTPVMARRGAPRPQPLGFLVADHEEFPEARGSVSVDPDAMRTRARSTSGVR